MDMSSLPKDCFGLIVRYLCPVDIVNWAFTCKRFKTLLLPYFKTRAIELIDGFLRRHFDSVKPDPKKLEKERDQARNIRRGDLPFGAFYEDFRRAMIRSGSIITGEFILQMLNGCRYGSSLIDIYSQTSCYKDLAVPIWDHMRDVISLGHAYCPEFLYHYDGYHDALFKGVNVQQISAWGFEETEEGFDGVHVLCLTDESEISPREAMLGDVMFSALSNLFWYDEDGPHLEIHDLSAIVHQKIRIDRAEYIRREGILENAEEHFRLQHARSQVRLPHCSHTQWGQLAPDHVKAQCYAFIDNVIEGQITIYKSRGFTIEEIKR